MSTRSTLPRLAFASLLVMAPALLIGQATGSATATQARPAPANAKSGAARPAPSMRVAPPDPDLFDGGGFEAEPRPDKGMLAEFELPGSEERPDQLAQVQNGAKQQGGQGQQGPQTEQAGGGAQASADNAQGGPGGGRPQGPGDPNAKAEGIAVADLQVDEGSARQDELPPKPREVGLGDQSGRIPTAAAQANVIGSQPQAGTAGSQSVTNTQGYEKGAAAGRSSGGVNNQNKGVERGKAIPEGL